MEENRIRLIVAVSTLLTKDNKVFLVRRKNTGWEDGKYCLPGGHLDGNETARQAAIREVKEEAGVSISLEDLKFFNISHLITNSERVHIYFYANKWKGEPKNNEKNKADRGEWFPIDNLPENTIDAFRDAIRLYKNSVPYSEFGWDK